MKIKINLIIIATGPRLKNCPEVTGKQTPVHLFIPHAAKDVFLLLEK